MTIVQKAQRFDEAIERARKELQICGSQDCDAARQIFRFFPELKELDDEKIRKKLLSSFKGIMADADEDELWYGLPYNDIIAWLENIPYIIDREKREGFHLGYRAGLEKQGEHTNFLSKIQVGDKVTRNKDGVLVNLSQLKRVAKPAEKQGELIGDTDTVDSNEDGLIAETMKYKREQKSAWSEEDEKMLDTVIEDIVKLAGPYICYHTDVEWLKSLKDRVQPQPKQEWSEEDEKMLDLIIAIFEVNYPNGYFKANELNDPDMKVVYTKEIVTWLKSLKERYTWKLSDEQILAIETAINVIGKGTLNGKQLVELQEQLKKLREK